MADRLRKMNLYPSQTYQEKIIIDTKSKRPSATTTTTTTVGSKKITSISCNSIMSTVFRGQRGEKGGCGCGR
jgi:hypothetical protein